MSATRRRFGQEFKDELCREVIDTSKPIVDVARSYIVGVESLRRWLLKYRESHGGTETELTANDPLNLLALDGPANAGKGDSDAETWLPPNNSFRCEYSPCKRPSKPNPGYG